MVHDQGGNSSDAGFVRWWFGGFSCAGALTAGTLVAVLVNEEVLPTLGIALIAAIPGAILGLAVGTGWVSLNRSTEYFERD
jgi:hypothetical protein